MKRVGHLWPQIVSFEALHAAARRASRCKPRSEATCAFLCDLEPRIFALQRDLEGGVYHPGPYRTFRIRDPKPRTISAAPFRDRVVHHALCAALEPVFERVAIHHAYACRPGRGQHRAVQRAQTLARRHPFFLKLDIDHYFESIDHAALKGQLRRLIKDQRALDLIDRFIDAGAPGAPPGRGLPIGNLTSQHFANLHLAPLDHLIQEQTPARSCLRYMDDVLLFGDDKPALWQAHEAIVQWLADHRLTLKRTSTRLAPVRDGIPFLSLRIWPDLIRLDGPRKRRFIRRFKDLHRLHDAGEIDEEALSARGEALIAGIAHANTANLRRSIFRGMF